MTDTIESRSTSSGRKSAEKDPQPKRPDEDMTQLDEELDDSFPASDPPSSTGGVVPGGPKDP